jgi:hypothetical protein
MRKIFIAIVLALSPLVALTPLHAQETTVSVGFAGGGNLTAGTSITGNVATESLSTAQIDSVLRVVAPGTFGQNFTRDKANKIFQDFANFRVGLAASLAQTIASQPGIRRVNSVTINTNALNLRLSQKTNSVSGQLGTIMARVSLLASGPSGLFCPSVTTSFDVDNIKASADYNYITGQVNSSSVTYDLTNVTASCNGFFGFVGNIFGDPAGQARIQINAAIQGQVDAQLNFVNMQRLFSLSEFVNGLRYYGNESLISAVANRGIGVLQELVNNAAINTPNIVLDFGVQFASSYGQSNKISIIASHSPTDFALVRRTLATINVTQPANTERVDFYVQRAATLNWQYMGSTVTDVFTIPPAFVNPNTGGFDWSYVAVSRNSILGGLESVPYLIPIQPFPGGPGR